MSDSIEIVVNGTARRVGPQATLASLLETLELPANQVAVEVNLTLVPRAQHAAHRLAPGDCVEIVTLVGGG